MSTDSLFKQATTATGSGTDAPNWTLGVEGSSAQAGSITAIWWSPPAGATGAVGWRIYEGHIGESHTLLGSGSLGAYTAAGGWQRFAITPVTVTGNNFMVCLYTSSHGDYAYATGLFPVNDGILVSAQGGFAEAADAAPTLSSSLSYMIDFEFTYGSSIAQAINPALETDTAQTLGLTKTRSLGVAPETDTAQTLARTKTRTLGVAPETDSAVAVGRLKTRSVGVASYTETAMPFGRVKSRTLGIAAETASAVALARSKTRVVHVAVEADQAMPLHTAAAAGPGAPHTTVRLRTARVRVRDNTSTVTYRGSGRAT